MRTPIASTTLRCLIALAVTLLLASCAQFRSPFGAATPLKAKEVNQFAAGIRPQQGDAGTHYRVGCYLQARNKHRPAIESFKAALAIDPAHVKAYDAMGVSYDLLGEYQRAVGAYTAALQIDGRQEAVLNNLGYSYLLQGKAELAVETFQQALAIDGGNARYRNNLALALAQSGRYADALTAFKESGDPATAHHNIGRLHYRAGRTAEAQAHFKAASIFKPPQPETPSGLRTAGVLNEIVGVGKKTPLPPKPMIAAPAYPAGLGPGGFRVIPAEALGSLDRPGTAPPAARTGPVVRMAPGRGGGDLAVRPTVHGVLEAESAAHLSPAQARELLELKARNRAASRIRIEVANGNGVRHMARNVGDFLKGGPVALMYLSNAQRFNHAETTIYYVPGYLHEAYRIARRLPGRQKLEAVPEIRGGHAEISVLIGRDLVSHIELFHQG